MSWFTRAKSISFACKGVTIFDENGNTAGCVDLAGFDGQVFRVEGWANAMKVTLHFGAAHLEVTPNLPREDVAEVFGFYKKLGFYVEFPVTHKDMKKSDPPGLTFKVRSGVAEIPPLSLPISHK